MAGRTTHASRTRFRPRTLILGLSIVAGIGAPAVWTGCSTPEDRYEVLSFFFDGVPRPGEVPGVTSDSIFAASRVTYYKHEPFVQGTCEVCHTSGGNFGMSYAPGFADVSDAVCLECHADVTSEFEWMHGPVVAVACLACHEAHESKYQNLLLEPSPDICMKCHDLDIMNDQDTPEHSDPTVDCMLCHAAHGADNAHLLLPSASAVESADEEWSDAPEDAAGRNDADASIEGETEPSDAGHESVTGRSADPVDPTPVETTEDDR